MATGALPVLKTGWAPTRRPFNPDPVVSPLDGTSSFLAAPNRVKDVAIFVPLQDAARRAGLEGVEGFTEEMAPA